MKIDIHSISDNLQEQSKYFCHRDFHSKNLLVHANNLVVIDFQDARLGSASYDLVSLCFDAYVPLSTNQRLKMLSEEIQLLSEDPNTKHIAEDVKKNWPSVYLQRQLKAIGSFLYLSTAKPHLNFSQYILPAISTLAEVTEKDKRWPYLSKEFIHNLEVLFKNEQFT